MIKKILFMLLFIFTTAYIANAQTTYAREGNTFVSKSTHSSTGEPKKTKFTWKDSKGKEYPIYISNSGSCYVIKTSSKTGKEYKQYLGTDISLQICKELGIAYKGKKS